MVSITLSYNKTKFWGKDFVYYKHNYILEYFDILKINSKLKNTIVIKIAKEYYPSDIS